MSNIKVIKGQLGSIRLTSKQGLEIKPLTVFIGKQGTGKSLLSQLAYFFYNLPYLVNYQQSVTRSDVSSNTLIRAILDNLRSDKRAFGVFANPTVTVEWDNIYKIRIENINRDIYPHAPITKYVKQIMAGDVSYKKVGKAFFIPAERVIYAHASRPSIWKWFTWPSTLALYGDAMEEAKALWENNQPRTPQGQMIQKLSRDALGGDVILYGGKWRWQIDEKTRIDIDMASSGQKANFSWLLLAQTIFEQREKGLIDEPFRLHIEEPEIHLHPASQRTMMRILAYLVNQGIEVLFTTHSLTMLYELNNLMTAAHKLPKDLRDERVPAPEFRISSDNVAAYLFRENGEIESLIEHQNIALDDEEERLVPWINEDQLRQVDEELGQELSRIRAYGESWEG